MPIGIGFSILTAALALPVIFLFGLALVLTFKNVGYDAEGAWFGFVLATLLFLSFVLPFTISTGEGNGSGSATGVISNLADQGWSFQNREVWLTHDGEVKAERFGVDQDDEALWARLAALMEAGARVRVTYTSDAFCAQWRQNNCDVIQSVEAV